MRKLLAPFKAVLEVVVLDQPPEDRWARRIFVLLGVVGFGVLVAYVVVAIT